VNSLKMRFLQIPTNFTTGSKVSAVEAALLKDFWKQQKDRIMALKITEREEFKNLTDLPLARIKRIMKADDDVRMIRAEAPVLFAKACELFILELTLRSYFFTGAKERNNMTREDVQLTVNKTGNFDFLIEILKEREESLRKKMEARAGLGGGTMIPSSVPIPSTRCPVPPSSSMMSSNDTSVDAAVTKAEEVV